MLRSIDLIRFVPFIAIAMLLSSCGGGGAGQGAGTVVSTLSFPWQSGDRNSIISGYSGRYSVSGSCNGTAVVVDYVPVASTFLNTAGSSVYGTMSISFSDCNPSFLYGDQTSFYDSNYAFMGMVGGSGSYGVAATPVTIPASVKVGDSGTLGVVEFWSDLTKTFSTGHDELSYVVEADTADTAIINLIDRSYDVNGVLAYTEKHRSRIKADGTMIPVSVEIETAGVPALHLYLTALPDTDPPMVSSTVPTSYSTDVPVYSSVSVTFSEAMDATSVTADTFQLMEVNGASLTPVSGEVSCIGRTATFTPSAALSPATVYRVMISVGANDLAGNALGASYTAQFQTGAPDTTAPYVLSTSPSNASTDVPVAGFVSATFSEPVDPATVSTDVFTLSSGTTPVAGSVTVSGATATFTPLVPLATGTTYTVSIAPGVKDMAGNAMSSPYSWQFQTYAPPAPTVSSSGPLPYDFAVPLDSTISATFSRPLDPSTVNGNSFVVTGGGVQIAGTVSYSGSTATFTPSAPLVTNTVYTATITTGVMDLNGLAMASDYSWTFQTFSLGSTTGPVNPVPAGLWQPDPGATPATGNFVYLQSDVGDYIGVGGTYTYTQADTIISVSTNGARLVVGINGDDWWSGNFKAMDSLTQLQAGFYPGLKRYPFHNPVIGGLDWSGNGRGCNTEKGWFAIDNISFDGNGALAAIDLRFEQNCEGMAYALHGSIHWTSSDTTTPPGPINPPPANLWQPAPGILPASGNYVYLESDTGDYVGQGQTYLYIPTTAVLSFGASAGSFSVQVNGNDSWYGNFETMNTLSELQPGYYSNLSRYPFHNPAKGGLDWYGNGRGCNSLTGWFIVDSATYVNGVLSAADIRFEQHCEGGTSALHGAIHWSS